MLVIHHLGISQSERIIWLCEELGLPYDLKIYPRDPQTRMAPAAYRALDPMGIAPIIEDGGVKLGESGAIMEYILAKYGHGQLTVTPDQPDYPAYLFWFHFANGTMMPAVMSGIMKTMLQAEVVAMAGDMLTRRGDLAHALVEQRLGEAPYFAGDSFTAADIIMLFPLTTMRYFAPKDLSGAPNTLAYLARIGARPAYQRAMQKGDPTLQTMLS